jgi:hypothetical protein
MKRMVSVLLTGTICGLVLFFNCTQSPVAGGTSTSENGRVTGKVVAATGGAAGNVQVSLLPAAYDPVADTANLAVDTTDANGTYSFIGVAPGDYSVEGVHLVNRTRLLVDSFRVADDTVALTDVTLHIPGAIQVTLPERQSDVSGHVYIPGTSISASFSSGDTGVELDSVPAGVIPVVAYAEDDAGNPKVLRYGVDVRPETVTSVRQTAWNYSERLRLNTTSTGAGISEAVYRFPVLIRLTERNFNFGQAGNGGNDLLFTTADDSPLPFEIERWDPDSGLAEVWVRLDSIPGNDTGTLFMYWGNSGAPGLPENGVVFDTAAGFSAVWHLGEAADTLHDVTVNRYNGTRYGALTSSAGIIGVGQQFGTAASYADMGNVLNPEMSAFTISAWVKRSDTTLQTVIAKSDGGSPSVSYGWVLSFGVSGQVHFFAATGGDAWGTVGAFDIWSDVDRPVFDTTDWHFITVVIDRSDNNRCRIFIDGEDVTMGTNGDIADVGSVFNTVALRLGAEADGEVQWTGMIDECSVALTSRSADWIRLCYNNQKTENLLVEFDR